MSARGRGDQLVWDEFAGDPQRLAAVAAAIRANLNSLSPAEAEQDEPTEAEEGALLTGVHRKRERNSRLRATKKRRVSMSQDA